MSRLFDQNIHKRYLSLLLTELAKAFSEKIAFKGGTCAYFFYNLPRFSFDLDFDMLREFSAVDADRFRERCSCHGAYGKGPGGVSERGDGLHQKDLYRAQRPEWARRCAG